MRIRDCKIELQPMFGDAAQGVLHVLSGGEQNPNWFGGPIRDMYACFAQGAGILRGEHFHKKLDELFLTVNGAALWFLCDQRTNSPTFGSAECVAIGWQKPNGLPDDLENAFVESEQKLPRLRVPSGVWHAFAPLGDERCLSIAIGTTAYDASDYFSPTLEEMPELAPLLERFRLNLAKK